MKTLPQSRRVHVGMLVVAASLVGVLGYHVIYGEHGYLTLRREKQQLEALHKQTIRLQQENDTLQKQIIDLNSDPKTIERRAREDSLMAKPGEIIIRYSENGSKGTTGAEANTPAPSSSAAKSADPAASSTP